MASGFRSGRRFCLHCDADFLAAANKIRLTQSDFVCPAFWAAASISAISDASRRQYSRPALDAPLGSGGLPRLAFFDIC